MGVMAPQPMRDPRTGKPIPRVTRADLQKAELKASRQLARIVWRIRFRFALIRLRYLVINLGIRGRVLLSNLLIKRWNPKR